MAAEMRRQPLRYKNHANPAAEARGDWLLRRKARSMKVASAADERRMLASS